MINEVIDGVVAAIRAEWPDVPIYTGEVAQGLEEPCFSVRCIRPRQKQVVGRRYFKSHRLRIYYFPNPGYEAWREIQAVYERLFSVLELISCGGDMIRGTDMDTHIEDDVGIFMVNYDFFVHRTPEDEAEMEELEQMISAKEEIHEQI